MNDFLMDWYLFADPYDEDEKEEVTEEELPEVHRRQKTNDK